MSLCGKELNCTTSFFSLAFCQSNKSPGCKLFQLTKQDKVVSFYLLCSFKSAHSKVKMK